jgi:kinesin family protein 6/9
MEAIEENKSLLKTIYANAKALGEKVNHSRDSINVLKERIEKHRVECAHDYLFSGISNGSVLEQDQEEDDLLCCMDAEKRAYKEGFGQLRDTKKEIEHLNRLIEQNRFQLQAEFEVYWSAMRSPHVETKNSMKILNIPKLQLPVDSRKGTKSPKWQECNQETFHSPLTSHNQETNLHHMHAISTMVFPSSKHYKGTPREKFTLDHCGNQMIPHLIIELKA